MWQNKKLKQIASCIALAVIALIIGYTIFIPNEKTDGTNSPLAVYLENENGGYTKSIIKNFDEILSDYDYDHIDCGSASENAKWSWNNGTLSATGINAHTICKVYFNEATGAIRITNITVDGNSASSVPTQMNYHVEPTCSGAVATWNYASWGLDVNEISSEKASCSLAFTTITSSNLASKFTGSTAAGKYLNTYIKSLAGTTSGTGNVTNYGTTSVSPCLSGKLESNQYVNQTTIASSNGTSYAYTWNATNKTWTSGNKNVSSSQSIIQFKVPLAGTYSIDYTISSESNYDYVTFYKNGTELNSGKTLSGTKTGTQSLGSLTTSDVIKVQYYKDGSVNSGNDNVVFSVVPNSACVSGLSETYHDIGIRYTGANPNNYVKFNNELWRIIGIFREAKTSALSDSDTYYTKIIRNESIGGYAYNGVDSNGGWWSKSDGSVSTLNYLLNHYYIGDNNNYDGTSDTTNCKFYGTTVTRNCDYRVIGIQPGWRDMVINTTWYTAAGADANTASTSFTGERDLIKAGAAGGELSYKDTVTNKYSKVGLMYPSDYLYAGGKTGWLLQGQELTISPYSGGANYAWVATSNGNLIVSLDAVAARETRPTVYLSSNVYITGGTGTLIDPYIISGR